MKKILLVCMLFLTSLCFAADYLVIKDRNLYDGNFNAVGAIKKGTVVKKNSTYTYSPKRASVQPDFKKGTDILYKGKEYVIDEEAIIPFETKELFDENVITSNKKLQGKYLTYIEDCDVLYSRERETYYKLHENAINYYENHIRGDYDGPWYENETINPSGISNIDLTLRTDSRVMLLIKKITKITDGYEVETEVFRNDYDELDYDYELFSEYFKPGSDATVIIICDGDYINFYTKEKRLLVTCAYVDEEFATQYERLIQEDLCDLTNIIWPRHADGTCDYDNSSKTKTVVSRPSTNVAPNKIMSVSENLKLRSGEATTTSVLTVMSAGTKVKILELGKAETIDGINSNWVKVEIISGKDRDGNKLKSGMTGWCYGGYLE